MSTSSHAFFSTVRAYSHSLTASQLAGELGCSIGEAGVTLRRYATKTPGAKVVLTATTLEQQRAAAATAAAKQSSRRHAKGMQLKPSADAVELESIAIGSVAAAAASASPSVDSTALAKTTIYESVYVFPPTAEVAYLSASTRHKVMHILATYVGPALFFLLQFFFGLALLLSILVLVTCVIILIILMLSNKKGGGGGGGLSFGGGGGGGDSGSGGGGGGGRVWVDPAPNLHQTGLPPSGAAAPVHYHHHYYYNPWWDRLFWDLHHPPLYHQRYERDVYNREVVNAPAAARGPIAFGPVPSSGSSSSKPAPPMPGDGDDAPHSIGGHRPFSDPSMPRRFPPNDDDDDDDGDEEHGGLLGVAGEFGRGAAGGDEAPQKLAWYQSIFSFVFGNGRPMCPPDGASFDTCMWNALANRIRAAGGIILAEECMPFVLDMSTMNTTVAQQMRVYLEDESEEESKDERDQLLAAPGPVTGGSRVIDPHAAYMLPILAHFNGFPVVSPDGRLIAYHFPVLAAQHHRLRAANQHDDPNLASVHAYAREPLWRMSHCTKSQTQVAIGLGVFNLILVLAFPAFVRWTGQQELLAQNEANVDPNSDEGAANEATLFLHFAWWLLTSVQTVYPVLLTYALGFFAIPVVRYFILKYFNRLVVERNARRQAWADAVGRRALRAFQRKREQARRLGVIGQFYESDGLSTANEAVVAPALSSFAPASSSASAVAPSLHPAYFVAGSPVSAPSNGVAPASSASSSLSSSSVSTAIVYESVTRRVDEEMDAFERAHRFPDGSSSSLSPSARPANATSYSARPHAN